MHAAARIALVTGALLAVGTPAVETSAGAATRRPAASAAVRRATRLLQHRMITRYTETSTTSFDQRLHLCARSRFIYDTVSSSEAGVITSRTRGRWAVVSARFGRRAWTARVRGYPTTGGTVTFALSWNGRVLRVDGALASIAKSDLC